MYRDSIIIMLSDNGANPEHGGSNWPLRGSKGYLFEGGVRVPAFIHAPRYVPAGVTYEGIFHISDWLPTLIEGFIGGDLASLASTAKALAAGDALHNATQGSREWVAASSARPKRDHPQLRQDAQLPPPP